MRPIFSAVALLVVVALATPVLAAGPWTVSVPASGNPASVLLQNGSFAVYDVVVTGTYKYGAGAAFVADASRSWGHPTGGACYNFPNGVLDLTIDGVHPWDGADAAGYHAPPRVPPPNGALVSGGTTTCRASDHKYAAEYSCLNVCRITFSIVDTSYGDNSGALTVKITQRP